MIRSYKGVRPRVAASAYIDRSAQVLGDVEIGERSSVWLNTVIRGDVNYIRIGQETSIQDLSCLHVNRDPSHPLVIGNRVTVGHSVTVHGCVIEDECLISMGVIILNGARIGTGSIIGAGALVTEGTDVPPRSLFLGSPAKLRRAVTDDELEMIRQYARNYVAYRETYLAENNA